MKAKVLIPFRDKYTGKKHKKDAVIELNAERINEIVAKSGGTFIQLLDDEAVASKKESK